MGIARRFAPDAVGAHIDKSGFARDFCPSLVFEVAEAANGSDKGGSRLTPSLKSGYPCFCEGGRLLFVEQSWTEARRSSVLVIENGRPIGRLLADDVVDALLPERGRLHFPRFLQ